MITVSQITRLIGSRYTPEKMILITNALNQTFEKYKINTSMRISHFLAQICHESGAFRWSAEIWGNTVAQQRYDTRVDLGNSPERDGDGYKYRGRGWIQLTGKANYKMLSNEFGVDFVSNPDLVAQEPWDALSAGYFWTRRGLNAYADLNDIMGITKRINGGFNGLEDRKQWFAKAKSILSNP